MLSIHARKYSPVLAAVDENRPLENTGETHTGPVQSSPAGTHGPPHAAFIENEYRRWQAVIRDQYEPPGIRSRQNKKYRQRLRETVTAPEPVRNPDRSGTGAYGAAENFRKAIEAATSDLLWEEYHQMPGFRIIKSTYHTGASMLKAVVGIDNARMLAEGDVRKKLQVLLGGFAPGDRPAVNLLVRIASNPVCYSKTESHGIPEPANPVLEDRRKHLRELLVEPFYGAPVKVSPDNGPGSSQVIPLSELVIVRLHVQGNTLHCVFLPRRHLSGETRRRVDLKVGKLKADIAAAMEPLLAGNPSIRLKTRFDGIGPFVVQLAGHATGDMYNVAASLLLDPTRTVMISRLDPNFSHPDAARQANMRVYDRSATISAFLKHGLPGHEHWRISIISVRGMKESAERERLKRLSPGIPLPLEKSMAQVANQWGPDYCVRLRRQWGLRPLGHSREQPYDKQLEIWLRTHGLLPDDLKAKNIIILWSRFSGKRGDLHPEHDTSFRGMRQLVDMAQGLADVVIITGDSPLTGGLEGSRLSRRKNKYKQLETGFGTAVSGAPVKVRDLTEFWNEQTTRTWCTPGNRTQQFRLYDYLHRVADVKHLGMRSGILLALALLGYDTCYMEEPFSVGSKRMEKFEHKLGNLSLIRIDTPPTRTGKAIKQLLCRHWSKLSWTAGKPAEELAGVGTSPSCLSNIKYTPAGRIRGLRPETIDPRLGQYVERTDLTEKPDVTGLAKGFTVAELESIRRQLARDYGNR